MRTTTLEITKMVHNGYGIGFADDTTWFVPYTLPGELCTVKASHKKNKVQFATLVAIEKPSPFRQEPKCPNFGICGGCSYLHTSYENELALKKEIIADCLTRIAKRHDFPKEKIETIFDQRFGYRSNATFKTDGKTYGFYKSSSNSCVSLPNQGCLLLSDALNNWSKKQTKFYNDVKVVENFDGRVLTPDDPLFVTTNIAELSYTHSRSSFFQANRFLRERMLNEAITFAAPSGDERVLDAGCGSGFFTLAFAKLVSEIQGFDTDKEAIRFAKSNAKLNKIGNAHFINASFDSYKIRKDDRFELVIADPPRSGLSSSFIERVCKLSPDSLVYVSCEPSSFARDTRLLSSNYQLEKLSFIDMFPGTYHIELISLFKRI